MTNSLSQAGKHTFLIGLELTSLFNNIEVISKRWKDDTESSVQ